LLRLAADQGNARAQNNLACMYRDGEGVTQDNGKAVRLFRLAAAQSHPLAQCALRSLISHIPAAAKASSHV